MTPQAGGALAMEKTPQLIINKQAVMDVSHLFGSHESLEIQLLPLPELTICSLWSESNLKNQRPGSDIRQKHDGHEAL